MLTAQEIRIVLFVLAMLLLGTVVGYFRSRPTVQSVEPGFMMEEVQFKRKRPIPFPE